MSYYGPWIALPSVAQVWLATHSKVRNHPVLPRDLPRLTSTSFRLHFYSNDQSSNRLSPSPILGLARSGSSLALAASLSASTS